MKYLIALLLLVSARKLFASPPTITVSSGFAGGNWVGNLECRFFNQDDCNLSIHVNGRRIDSSIHNSNEDVLMSCLTALPSLDLVINDFSYNDIGDYTCLDDTTQEFDGVWLPVAPVIESPGTFIHGQPATLVCNAPLGSPVYWILPGSIDDHQLAVITDTSNSQNASSTITFTFGDTDHFSSYNCCIALKDGQPPSQTCASFTVADEDLISEVVTTADYSGLQLFFTVDLHSNPLVDSTTVVWQSCITQNTCTVLTKFNYDVQDDPADYRLTSQLTIFDDGLATFYTFSVNTIDGTAQRTATFPLSRGSYYPQVTRLPATVYYNQDDLSTTVVLKFIIDATPAPTVTWTKQQTREESLGAETITTGGRYVTSLSQDSDTQWTATLAISPFDFTQDDAIYTIHAENEYGVNCVTSDATVGPNYLNFVENTNSTAKYSYTCVFEEFPYPPAYEINIVAPYAYNCTIVNTVTDPQLSQTAVTVEVGLDSQNTYFQITCTAFDPYDALTSRSQSISAIVS